MTDLNLPELEIDPPRRSLLRNLSVVWLVPVLAVVVSLGIAWKNFSDRGTLVTITFSTAAGVIPGETTLKFREVVIGTVENVQFTPDLQKVIISARIQKDVAETLPSDSQFWVVRPNVSANGVTGLSTVLSGVYIEGAWLPVSGSVVHSFTGLEAEPILRPGRKGMRITLRSKSGSLLPAGGPILFHGVEVGKLDVPRITDTGDSVLVDAFINAPNDKYITTATRFWDTSGFSVKLGPSGVALDVSSLGSLLRGGIAFDTTFTGGEPIKDTTVFNLFDDEDAARQSIFTQIGDDAVPLAVIFTGSVNGLAAGAQVEYHGFRIGQVTGINAFIERTSGNGRVVKLRTEIEIDPQALGLQASTGKSEVLAFLRDAVSNGLRARLVTTSIFSPALKIELAELPDEPKAEMIIGADSVPVLPSVVSDLPDLNATADGMLKRINGLPIEELMQQAISLMASIEAVAGSDDTRAAPGALVKLLDDTRGLINKDDTQAIPTELRGAIVDLRKVVEDLQKRGASEKLVTLLENANKVSANLDQASQSFPQLIKDLQELAAKAKGLKAEELIDSTTKLIQDANAVIGTDGMKSLPADLSGALVQIQAALKELREGGAVDNVNAALASAKDAADSVAQAADGLPKLTAELDALVGKANALVAAYGAKSNFNDQTLQLLRDLQAAAKAATQLARTIERNPNSLLIGR
ncbi:paraquat-inducible protein B [Cypionkella aquatica]|uniref:Paraquat-inducible protein B n=1 Tax=Cypionkella aquatica TaxID=1756042 RepID=A0AA37TZ48_9RHOB|nr:MlaD family protein [Cypionkella aquatica]GLS85164.1 paraquat-inducible protein B [Cypionkella aquatica]